MISSTLAALDVMRSSAIGLAMFASIFTGTLVWALTRSRKDVQHWSAMPLEQTPVTPADRHDRTAQKEEGE